MTKKSPHETSQTLRHLSLGTKTDYKNNYDASILQGVPRSLNRDNLQLKTDNLPFIGFDLWNIYELSWLNLSGKPMVATGMIRVPFDSENLIESKSLKLYLNSFNQTKFSTVDEVKNTMQRDLTSCASKIVTITLQTNLDSFSQKLGTFTGSCIDHLDIDVDNYQFSTHYLENISGSQEIKETLYSHLLKSNCLITHQPDWGSVAITYSGKKLNQEKLLRYLISFRNHNEFHEQCVERIYCDLMKFAKINTLCIDARYTRRGGIDINPLRSTTTHENINNIRLLRQ
ncbi:MAG: NADPH-dependent 7-cyano-7-deazaguanine reductase QueF [Psychromonas sp.]|nr:NADPH-dependent 7-cyano-7-deazaguanine reductase QueF [Psychromonas sp.]